ncbi:MAG: hypothetical protein DA405_07650 [Bacteroidetes bacterium]|nr:MAG: hypothetical protein DA405_07650 [Bacteroidota bacterium]
MDNNLYSIRNTACQYKSNIRPVLQLDKLDIERGKTYFIVGSSGVGKSTILETLGVMNNTIKVRDGGFIRFHSRDTGETQDIDQLWNKKESVLARFRKNNLSFIFQSTNLFGNLTAYQNASITPVLKGEKSEAAKLRARQLLAKLYPKDFVIEIIKGKKVAEMSGGQRQRLAFARALGSDYEVLLADEPTGNLDHHNAHKLMKMLTDVVHRENRTSIIVSHDIELSVTYGDCVVLIAKQEVEEADGVFKYGLVNEQSVYERYQQGIWRNKGSREELSDSEIIQLLKNAIKDSPN